VAAKAKTPFEDKMLEALRKQSSLTGNGINAETLTAIRTRFILDWNGNTKEYPFACLNYKDNCSRKACSTRIINGIWKC
jgi:hypothetical protein